MIYWFTGQPGHGKTTLAKKLKAFIENLESSRGAKVVHIDGDDLRTFTKNKDYSVEGRRNNILLAQHIAHFLHKDEHIVVVSVIAPFRDMREIFKSHTGCREIYVYTNEVRGKEHFHTEYEPPLENFLSVDTTDSLPEDSLELIIKHFGIK
jgi:adenylylsulfate kinase-like enzyme